MYVIYLLLSKLNSISIDNKPHAPKIRFSRNENKGFVGVNRFTIAYILSE